MDLAIIGIIAAVAITFIWKAVYIVPQGYEFTRERLGQFVGVMDPGLHILMPFLERVGQEVSMMEQVIEIPAQHVISADNATIQINAICYIQVIDSKKATYEVDDPIEAITQLASTNFRSVLGSMELDKILSGRESINSQVMAALDGATAPWGVKVTRCELSECAPDQDLLDAMSAQMKAERFKRASILEAEGVRAAEIARAEGDKQSKILRAEGEKQAAILNSEAREREAQAEAEATKIVSAAIKDGDAKSLQYFISQKYIESFGRLAESENSKFIIMPAELTSLAQTVQGIAGLVANKNS